MLCSLFCCPRIHLSFWAFIFCRQSYYILPQSSWKLPSVASISQQETVIAISYSQVTSPQPDESEEYFRHAALSLATSFAELLWVIIHACLILHSCWTTGRGEQRLHPCQAARTGSHLCVSCAWDMRTYLCGLFKFCRRLAFQCFPRNQQISVFLAHLSECVFPTGDSMIFSPSGNSPVVLPVFHMRKWWQW